MEQVHQYIFDNILISVRKRALGMENGNIRDHQITASTEYDTNHRAANGRLNFTPRDGRKGAWSSRDINLDQWLQVDLTRSTLITGISTQGRKYVDQFVKSYTVSSSQDGTNYKTYTQEDTIKVFSPFLQVYTKTYGIFCNCRKIGIRVAKTMRPHSGLASALWSFISTF